MQGQEPLSQPKEAKEEARWVDPTLPAAKVPFERDLVRYNDLRSAIYIKEYMAEVTDLCYWTISTNSPHFNKLS